MKSIMMMPRLRNRSWRAFNAASGWFENRFIEDAADKAAGVDIDRGERFGLVEDQVASGLQIDTPCERFFDLVLDPVQVEQRPLAGIMLEPFGDGGRELERESLRFLERFARIDQNARGFVVGEIAQHAQA